MLVGALLCASCLRDRGCSAHPVFPAPSVFEGKVYLQNSGRIAPRDRERIFSCHHPRKRVIQYSRETRDDTDRPRRTGYPACAGYDNSSWSTVTARSASDEAIQLSAMPCDELLRFARNDGWNI